MEFDDVKMAAITPRDTLTNLNSGLRIERWGIGTFTRDHEEDVKNGEKVGGESGVREQGVRSQRRNISRIRECSTEVQ